MAFKTWLMLGFLTVAFAAPTTLEARSVTTVSAATVASYKPYTNFVGAVYCMPANTLAWNCGAYCDANPNFKPIASGGDGSSIQYWFVGYDPTLKTVIVSHQGTDASKIIPILTDANLLKTKLNNELFPGVPSSVEVHQGFADAHAKTASAVLAAVQTAMSTYGATSVTTVGHSLGGALSLLDAIYLSLHLPASMEFTTYTYGSPRVGNDAFAAYVDSRLSVVRITNKKDDVPTLPGRFLGYQHVSGEVHIQNSSGKWVACSGRDNTEAGCTIDDVPNVLVAHHSDHLGPYDGVMIKVHC